MPFAAVLDASVLYPLPLRDTLLRVAEIELYAPYWSQRILDEVARVPESDRLFVFESPPRRASGSRRLRGRSS